MPPSALSRVMKSGALSIPRAWIAAHKSSSHPVWPKTNLMPVGFSDTSRTVLIRSRSDSTDVTSGCRLGLIESLPAGMPRVLAMTSVTFSPGKMPPLPGFAPWESLISNILISGIAASSVSFATSSPPCSSRTPYLAVPI